MKVIFILTIFALASAQLIPDMMADIANLDPKQIEKLSNELLQKARQENIRIQQSNPSSHNAPPSYHRVYVDSDRPTGQPQEDQPFGEWQYDQFEIEFDFVSIAMMVGLGMLACVLKLLLLVACCHFIKRRNQRLLAHSGPIFHPQPSSSQPSLQNMINYHYREAQRLRALSDQRNLQGQRIENRVVDNQPIQNFTTSVYQSQEMTQVPIGRPVQSPYVVNHYPQV